MGLLGKLLSGGFIASDLYTGRTDQPLITFKGWRGRWWKKIKPGKAAIDALETVGPAKLWIPLMAWDYYRSRRRRRRR